MGGEGRSNGVEVAIRDDDRVGSDRRRDAGGVGEAERGHPGAGGDEEGVGVPVIAAGELQHDAASGGGPGDANGRHDRLGPRGGESDPLDRCNPGADRLGEFEFRQTRRPKGRRARDGRLNGLDNRRMGVADDRRTPAADEVDIGAPLDVGDRAAGGRRDESRCATYRSEGAHRRGHPSGHDGPGPGEQPLRSDAAGHVSAPFR